MVNLAYFFKKINRHTRSPRFKNKLFKLSLKGLICIIIFQLVMIKTPFSENSS
jgi:hypothetical protein